MARKSKRPQSNHQAPMILFRLLMAFTLMINITVEAHDSQAQSGSSITDSDIPSSFTNILDAAGNIEIVASILAVIAIVAGTVLCLSGYRLICATFFVCGFIAGGVIAASIAEHKLMGKASIVVVSWICFFIGGLIGGAILVSIYNIGIFVAGATGGVLLAYTLYTAVGHKLYPSNPHAALLVMIIVGGLIGGMLACAFEKPVVVCATSFAGAGLIVWGVGFFAGSFPTGEDLERMQEMNEHESWLNAVPGMWWMYLGILVALTCLGVVVQFKKTAHDDDRIFDRKGRVNYTGRLPTWRRSRYAFNELYTAQDTSIHSRVWHL